MNGFQFPTIGKVYPKACKAAYKGKFTPEFQFPTIGKVYPKCLTWCKGLKEKSFNSLQSGRCIQRQKAAIYEMGE